MTNQSYTKIFYGIIMYQSSFDSDLAICETFASIIWCASCASLHFDKYQLIGGSHSPWFYNVLDKCFFRIHRMKLHKTELPYCLKYYA